jgi:Serine carboxypeptidase
VLTPFLSIACYSHCEYAYGAAVLNRREVGECRKLAAVATELIHKQQWLAAENASGAVTNYIEEKGGQFDLDDIQYQSDPMAPLYYGLDKYLNDPAEKKRLHATGKWYFYNIDVYNALLADGQQSVAPIYKKLVEHGLKVWFYTGSFDNNVDHFGVEAFVLREFDSTQWWNAPKSIWRFGEGKTKTLAGYATCINNQKLCNIIVRNAGHEVPFFEPAPAADMFHKFVHDIPF